MKIDSIDFFYLSMPEILNIGDGSQDALLVRVTGGGLEGWGECEASPLTTIASYVCPMSHSACKPVKHSIEGMSLNSVEDIENVTKRVRQNSFDLLQSDHALSGIDIALWDLLGKYLSEPVFRLLGYKKNYPKLPYASQLFGDSPLDTYKKAKDTIAQGFKAVKFGWGPIGKSCLNVDRLHLEAAREGLGKDIHFMVDIGTVWDTKVELAIKRVQILKDLGIYWLEEPFSNLALSSYQKFSKYNIPLASGEGCNNFLQAKAMMDYGNIAFIQIDTGRIGGITTAKRIVDIAYNKNISYVNHTFTSHLALSASLQPFAGKEKDFISEYPIESKYLAQDITSSKILPDYNGLIHVPEKPGLGLDIDKNTIKEYLVDVEIRVKGELIYYTPQI